MKVLLRNGKGGEWIGVVDGCLGYLRHSDHDHTPRTTRHLAVSPALAAEWLAGRLEAAYLAGGATAPLDTSEDAKAWEVSSQAITEWPRDTYRLFVRAGGVEPALLEEASAFARSVCAAIHLPHEIVCYANEGMGPRVVFSDPRGFSGGLTFGFAPAEERRRLRGAAVEQLMLFGGGYGNDLLLGEDGRGHGSVVLRTRGALVDLPIRIFLSRLMLLSSRIKVSCMRDLRYRGARVADTALMDFEWWSFRTDLEAHLTSIGFSENADPAALLFAVGAL